MEFVLIVKVALNRPFAHWAAAFDADEAARDRAGVHTLFRHPVIGEQAVVFGVRTASPRLVHDMMYHPDVRSGIELSGLVVGSEEIVVCDGDV